MRSVHAVQSFPGSVVEAERCWYDTARWPRWVEGLRQVEAVEGDWPAVGSVVRWESGPAGRGSVVERVVAYEPRQGQTLEVTDGAIRGRQSVSFAPSDSGVQVTLELEYQLLRRSVVTPVVDLLFIRRAMIASLQTTVRRFGAELEGARRA